MAAERTNHQSINIGGASHEINVTPEASAIEVFRYRRDVPCLEMEGRITHKLSMRRKLGESVSEKLKSRQAEESAAKQERSVQTLEIDPRSRKGALKPGKTVVRTGSPARTSPFLQARKSPLLVASAPKAPVIPLKTRLIQILAISCASIQELSSRLRLTNETLLPVLKEVGQKSGSDWALRDDVFPEIKVWDWKHYTSAERTAAVSRAGEAFDRLGLAADHPARSKLIHPDKRTVDRLDTSPLLLNPPETVSRPATPSAKQNGLLGTGKETQTRSDRTCSLTSTSSSRSSKSQASTAPSSVTDTKTEVPSSEGSPKKRKATDDLESPAKRQLPPDMVHMAREYKRLYPEYKQLHDEVAQRIDKGLFSRFMILHNQMSRWKQILHPDESK